MAKILFAWELGGGYGHLAPHRELLGALIERGHQIHVAASDLVAAGRVFHGLPIRYWQAPVSHHRPARPFQPTITMAHVLFNVGFADADDVQMRVSAWSSVISSIQPDLLLCDYSPTALLASRSHATKRVILGTGFCIPPNLTPLPPFSTLKHLATDPGKLAADEASITILINEALSRMRLPLIGSLADIFHQVDATLLITIRELDHYPDRQDATYWGLPLEQSGVTVEWPVSDRRRVFAYLKPYAAIESLLALLRQLELPVIVACDGLSAELRQKYASGMLAFAPPNVDLQQMARDCHFAVTNANHTTTCRFLLAGKPAMVIPLQLEQELLAEAIRQHDLGVVVRAKEPRDAFAELVPLMNSTCHHEAAQALAARYAAPDHKRLDRMVDLLEGLLGRFNPPKTD